MKKWDYYRENAPVLKARGISATRMFDIRNIPVDVEVLCLKLGISVLYNPTQILQTETIVPANNTERPIIKVKNPIGESSYRKRTSIAHSVGHIMLHRPGVYSHSVVSYSSVLSQEDNEAGKFALELLMPEEFVFVEGMRLNGNIEKLSRIFGVPESWMRYRMSQVFPL